IPLLPVLEDGGQFFGLFITVRDGGMNGLVQRAVFGMTIPVGVKQGCGQTPCGVIRVGFHEGLKMHCKTRVPNPRNPRDRLGPEASGTPEASGFRFGPLFTPPARPSTTRSRGPRTRPDP